MTPLPPEVDYIGNEINVSRDDINDMKHLDLRSLGRSASGSIADKRVNRAPPLTKAKTHTNNNSRIHTMICAKNSVSWMRVFREELAKMNCGKINRSYSYMTA